MEARGGASPFYDRECGSAVQGGAGRRPGDEVLLLQAVPVINELPAARSVWTDEPRDRNQLCRWEFNVL